jgi:hypothetical protein
MTIMSLTVIRLICDISATSHSLELERATMGIQICPHMMGTILKLTTTSATGALLCLALSSCAGSPQAAPTVTHTVTQTATATVTATATATVTAEPVAPAVVAAPVPAPAAPTTALIPANVAGMNAEALDDELSALGFKKVVYNSDTGKTVLLLSNWTVTGIDNAGAEQAVEKAVVVHVAK